MSQVKIPHGEEKIMVELTVKEAIALTGIRFNSEPQIMFDARKKLKESLEQKTNSSNLH
jgi:hypothetical protein